MKRIIAIILAVLMLTSVVFADEYTVEEKIADAMNSLGLFLGTGEGYELETSLTRAQGVTLLVRMMGNEAAAESGDFETPFTDVPEWAEVYIGFAYENGITNGISDTLFDPDSDMTDYMFITLTLRALGYSDSGEDAEFVWNDPYELAYRIGLIGEAAADEDFIRGEAVTVFWNALSAKLKGQEVTLAESLVQKGVFTQQEYETAVDIAQNGKTENPGEPEEPEEPEESDAVIVVRPTVPVIPSVPDTPDTPDTPDSGELPDNMTEKG